VNLDEAVSGREPVFVYAYTEIYVAEPGFWKLSFGSNDGGRLWLNGQQIWDYAPNRGIYQDQDVLPVLLNKGNRQYQRFSTTQGGIRKKDSSGYHAKAPF
jgi:hypothetical protein